MPSKNIRGNVRNISRERQPHFKDLSHAKYRKSSSSYFMDPAEQYHVFQKLKQEKLELLAIYHSHQHSPAYPSPKDIDLAFYPETSMINISLLNPQMPSIKAFQVKEGKVKKQILKYF